MEMAESLIAEQDGSHAHLYAVIATMDKTGTVLDTIRSERF